MACLIIIKKKKDLSQSVWRNRLVSRFISKETDSTETNNEDTTCLHSS